MKKRPTIAITMGDPSGIGPEICLKALSRESIRRICVPVVIGDPGILERTAKGLSLAPVLRVVENPPEELDCKEMAVVSATAESLSNVVPGRSDGTCGKASVDFIERAVSFALSGRVRALVTAPISKASLHLAGLPCSGHTELLAPLSETGRVVMMFVTRRLKVSLVTRHLPLREAIDRLRPEAIEEVIALTHSHLVRWFRIEKPRIAVAGLNPHAGEGGLFGDEEEGIRQAVGNIRSMGIDVWGPLPADTIFYQAVQGRYDGVVSMYHDQGLIPIKLLDFRGAVNLTLGLPFVRTSVGHGTAHDIAGKGMADPSSLIHAIRLAVRLSH